MEREEDKPRREDNLGKNSVVIHIGTAYNVNPAATEVNNTFNIYSSEAGEAAVKEAMGVKPAEKPAGKKLGAMTIREMLEQDLIDTGNIQKEIMNYVSCIRDYVKEDMDKLYMRLWGRILDHEVFKIELYDPGKQDCHFNRNLVANIMHYLDTKKFYKVPYNQSAMTRAVEGDPDNPVRKGFREYPEQKYIVIVEEILKDLNS